MNEKLKAAIPYLFIVLFIIAGVLGISYFKTSIRDSGTIIKEISAENDSLKNQLGNIKNAVDGLGAGINEVAGSTVIIATGIAGVGDNLDESIAVLGELIEFAIRITDILEGRTITIP